MNEHNIDMRPGAVVRRNSDRFCIIELADELDMDTDILRRMIRNNMVKSPTKKWMVDVRRYYCQKDMEAIKKKLNNKE